MTSSDFLKSLKAIYAYFFRANFCIEASVTLQMDTKYARNDKAKTVQHRRLKYCYSFADTRNLVRVTRLGQQQSIVPN